MINLYATHDHILVLSDTVNADLHKHSFIQISISLESSFEIEVGERCFDCKGIAISSNVSHRFNSNHNKLLFLLIDNTSSLASPFKRLLGGHDIYIFPDSFFPLINYPQPELSSLSRFSPITHI